MASKSTEAIVKAPNGVRWRLTTTMLHALQLVRRKPRSPEDLGIKSQTMEALERRGFVRLDTRRRLWLPTPWEVA